MIKDYLILARTCRAFLTSFFLFCACLLTLLGVFIPQAVSAEQAKLVKTDSVGGHVFVDVAEINGIHYFASYSEDYLKVYDLSQQGEDVVLGMIKMPGEVDSIVSWQNMLVVSSFKRLDFYQANSTEVSLVHSVPFSAVSDAMLAASERYLLHAGNDGQITVFEQSGNGIQEVGSYVFESGSLDIFRLNMGIEDDTFYITYVTSSGDGSGTERVVMKLELRESELVSVDEFSLPYAVSSVTHFSAYIGSGRFAYFDYVNPNVYLRVIGDKEGKLGELEIIDYPSSLRATGLAYWQNKLWVTSENYTVLSYDVSLSSARLESSTQIENPASSLLYPTMLKATESGLYGVATSALFKVNRKGQEVNFDFYFLNAGIESKAVSMDDFLFVPVDNRIFQYSLTADHKLQLENIYHTRDDLLTLRLHVSGGYIWGNSEKRLIQYQLVDGKLQEVADREMWFSTYSTYAIGDKLYISRDRFDITIIDTKDPQPLYTGMTHFSGDGQIGDYRYLGSANGHHFAIGKYDLDRLLRLEFRDGFVKEVFSLALPGQFKNVIYIQDLIYVEAGHEVLLFRVNEQGIPEQITNQTLEPRVSIFTSFDNKLITQLGFSDFVWLKVYDLTDTSSPKLIAQSYDFDISSSGAHAISIAPRYVGLNGGRDPYQVYELNYQPALPENALAVQEDFALNLDVREFDPEGDLLSVDITSMPSHGTLTFDTDTQLLTYEPGSEFSGQDSASVKLTDRRENVVEGELRFNVFAVNDAPTSYDQTLAVHQNVMLEGDLHIHDPDDETFVIRVLAGPSHGVLNMQEDGRFSYTPATDFSGSDQFQVIVEDSKGGSTDALVTLNVSAQNSPPELVQQQLSLTEDQAFNLDLSATDAEGDDVVFEVISHSDKLAMVEVNNGNLQIIPANDAFGSAQIELRLSDNYGGQTDVTLSLEISPVDDIPQVSELMVSLTEDASHNGELATQDNDGERLSYELAGNVQNGTLQLNSDGSFSYSPNSGFTGNDGFTYQVTDESGNRVEGTVSFSVNAKSNVGQPSSPSSSSSGGGGGTGLLMLMMLLAIVLLRAQHHSLAPGRYT